MTECYHNKWAITAKQCPKEGVWKGAGLYSITNEWTWCQEHAPAPPFRQPLCAPEAALAAA